jgi:transposase
MPRGDLTNAPWERLKPLLPPQTPKTGRPAVDHHRMLNGMLWVLRPGAPWHDMPERYGSWRTVASRFYRWQKAGVFQPRCDTRKQPADAAGRLDWQSHFRASTSVRAHQHAAGAKKGLRKPRREAAAKMASVPKDTDGPKAVASC